MLTHAIGLNWAIVQGDNRNTYMQQASFQSVKSYASWAGANHVVYSCNAYGWRKPALIKSECIRHDYVLWVDSDAVVKTNLNLSILEHLMGKEIAVLAGVDFKDTNEAVRKRTIQYVDYFNDGVFTVNCKAAILLLRQWKHYSVQIGSDQTALQHLARSNSIFSKKIAYDFEFLGVYSRYFAHFPGNYRNNFPRHQKSVSNIHKHRCNI